MSAPNDVLSKPILSGFEALDGTQTNFAIDVFRQIEMERTLDDSLVIEDVLKLMSAGACTTCKKLTFCFCAMSHMI
jgi:hypothetical protein